MPRPAERRALRTSTPTVGNRRQNKPDYFESAVTKPARHTAPVSRLPAVAAKDVFAEAMAKPAVAAENVSERVMYQILGEMLIMVASFALRKMATWNVFRFARFL